MARSGCRRPTASGAARVNPCTPRRSDASPAASIGQPTGAARIMSSAVRRAGESSNARSLAARSPPCAGGRTPPYLQPGVALGHAEVPATAHARSMRDDACAPRRDRGRAVQGGRSRGASRGELARRPWRTLPSAEAGRRAITASRRPRGSGQRSRCARRRRRRAPRASPERVRLAIVSANVVRRRRRALRISSGQIPRSSVGSSTAPRTPISARAPAVFARRGACCCKSRRRRAPRPTVAARAARRQHLHVAATAAAAASGTPRASRRELRRAVRAPTLPHRRHALARPNQRARERSGRLFPR